MATPMLDSIIMQCRVALKDLHDRATGAPITDASQDGRRWTVVQLVDDLITPAMNSVLEGVYNGLQGVPYSQRGLALAMAFPELTDGARAAVQHVSGGGYPPGRAGICALSENVGWLASVMLTESEDGLDARRVRLVHQGVVDAMFENGGGGRERGPVCVQQDEVLLIARREPVFSPNTNVLMRYVKQTRGLAQGTTDLRLAPRYHHLLVSEVRRRAEAIR